MNTVEAVGCGRDVSLPSVPEFAFALQRTSRKAGPAANQQSILVRTYVLFILAASALVACRNAPLPAGAGASVLLVEAQAELAARSARPVQPWPDALPTLENVPNDAQGKWIRRGIDLLTRTSELIGPNVDEAHRIGSININCVSCHPRGSTGLPGTMRDHLPWVNVVHDYPRVEVKTMKRLTLQDRVRGMFGGGRGKLTDDSNEMRAIVAYFEWLGRLVRPGHRLDGSGLAHVPPLARAADPVRGEAVYASRCTACHQADGRGIQNEGFARGAGYQIPPLAGDDTYGDGAHMYLVPVLARFLVGYMPLGAIEPLATEDAYDVAAYVNDVLPRPHSALRARLYPEPALRPPYFSIPENFRGDARAERRAKFGPFTDEELRVEP
jgi:cytochrome c